MSLPTNDEFMQAVEDLRVVVAGLAQSLSRLLGPPTATAGAGGSRSGADPARQLADGFARFNASLSPAVRTVGILSPALGRFAGAVTLANSQLAASASVVASLRRATPPAATANALGQWRGLLARGVGQLGSILPSGQTPAGFLGRQLSSLLTQGLQSAAGRAFQAVRGPVGQQLLTPQVANALASKIGQFQAWTSGRQFQTNLGVNVGQAVASALGRWQRVAVPAGAGGAGAVAGAAGGLGRALAGFAAVARLAGPIGLAVGAVAGLGHAVGRLVGDLGRYAEQINSGNRSLASWNASIAHAFLRLDLNSIRRERDLSRATERTTISLAESVDRMRQSWQGFDTFTANTRNRFARIGADFLTAVGNDASKLGALADRIGEFIDSRGGNTLGGRAAWAAVTGVWGVPALAGGDEGYGAGLWKLAKWSNPLLGTIFDLLANPPAPAEFTDQATAAFRFWARPNVGPFRPMDRPNMPGRPMP